jgi:hypothetical protein
VQRGVLLRLRRRRTLLLPAEARPGAPAHALQQAVAHVALGDCCLDGRALGFVQVDVLLDEPRHGQPGRVTGQGRARGEHIGGGRAQRAGWWWPALCQRWWQAAAARQAKLCVIAALSTVGWRAGAGEVRVEQQRRGTAAPKVLALQRRQLHQLIHPRPLRGGSELVATPRGQARVHHLHRLHGCRWLAAQAALQLVPKQALTAAARQQRRPEGSPPNGARFSA